MIFSPIVYEEPLFRPPSEARSLIFQVTIGCSWNKCAFCEMYTTKKFRAKEEDEIFREIEKAGRFFPDVRKVFLADGDAMMLDSDRLIRILNKIRSVFKRVVRVSAYAGARDLENKTAVDLTALKEAGLKLIYVGLETGDDELLRCIKKGDSAVGMERNLLKTKAAGIKSSVMILTGLGGKKYSRSHALESARLVSRIQPEYLSTLVLSFPYGVDHFKKRFRGDYIEMDTGELLAELYQFIDATRLDDVIFRSDHASNYLALKGVLGRDKDRMLGQITEAINNPGSNSLRTEWQRGL
jgi:radical SAM superfamily enzyme YgiQ (UPF0313 family)